MVQFSDIRRWLPFVAIAMATLSLCASVGLFLNTRAARDDICLSRNSERQVHRRTFLAQIQQTESLPDAVFKQFDTTKQEALARLHGNLKLLAPLDCDALTLSIKPLQASRADGIYR